MIHSKSYGKSLLGEIMWSAAHEIIKECEEICKYQISSHSHSYMELSQNPVDERVTVYV